MELKVIDLNRKETGTVSVNDNFFTVQPRQDILESCCQLAKSQGAAGGLIKQKGFLKSLVQLKSLLSKKVRGTLDRDRCVLLKCAAVLLSSGLLFAVMPIA